MRRFTTCAGRVRAPFRPGYNHARRNPSYEDYIRNNPQGLLQVYRLRHLQGREDCLISSHPARASSLEKNIHPKEARWGGASRPTSLPTFQRHLRSSPLRNPSQIQSKAMNHHHLKYCSTSWTMLCVPDTCMVRSRVIPLYVNSTNISPRS